MIWRDGFQTGALRSHVYPEVPRVLREWKHRGLDLRIYSSGSIEAQRQFFMHVDTGSETTTNLIGLINAHYDTTTGSKKEVESYRKITQSFQLPAKSILFLSDVVAELDAAQQAGMKTAILCRPENAPVPETVMHPRVHSLDDVHIV
ncbi:MAG TPA: acireductone synthase [Gemmatales bacterium]|nr:acireductone synthase [Gemmatales bacterium]